MDLEIINKLFLELSQFATAKTSREIALEKTIGQLSSDDKSVRCPICKSLEVSRVHAPGTFRLPETWYWDCDNCHHQFGHS